MIAASFFLLGLFVGLLAAWFVVSLVISVANRDDVPDAQAEIDAAAPLIRKETK